LPKDQPPSGCVELGSLIRAARRFRNLSQSKLAERVTGIAGERVSRERIAQWEHAHRRVSAGNLWRLELALNIIFDGVNRKARSRQHGDTWCEAATGVEPSFICRIVEGSP